MTIGKAVRCLVQVTMEYPHYHRRYLQLIKYYAVSPKYEFVDREDGQYWFSKGWSGRALILNVEGSHHYPIAELDSVCPGCDSKRRIVLRYKEIGYGRGEGTSEALTAREIANGQNVFPFVTANLMRCLECIELMSLERMSCWQDDAVVQSVILPYDTELSDREIPPDDAITDQWLMQNYGGLYLKKKYGELPEGTFGVCNDCGVSLIQNWGTICQECNIDSD